MPATALEQMILELVNRARLDPVGEAARNGIDLNEGVPSNETISAVSKQPLAMNETLLGTARAHSQDMIDRDYFAHDTPEGVTPFQRMTNAGYHWSTAGENIAYNATTGAVTQQMTLDLDTLLFVDSGVSGRGHRVNMLDGSFQEIGVGQVTGNFQGYNATMLTEDLGTTGSQQFLTGVSYADTDHDNFYSVGEGRNGMSVAAANGPSTSTAGAGGYSLAIGAGQQTVTFSGGGLASPISVAVTIAAHTNAKVDVIDQGVIHTSASLTDLGGATTIVGLGTIGLTLTGDGGADIIVGTSGNDTLNGGGGTDTMTGLAGNDLFYVDNTGDVVIEAPNGGSDTVVSTVNFTIPANVETLYVNGSGLTATGSSGADILESVGGANTLAGLGGDDNYVVNSAGDVVQEASNGGNDTVYATVSYTIPGNVERLIMTGAGLTGTGSGGSDVLGSSGGANTLIGLGGDDLYYVTNTGDHVQEAPGGGHDTVVSTVSLTIPDNVEALYVNGSGLTATGSGAADILESVGGANTLVGLGGDDSYVVTSAGDHVQEAAGAGTDTVYATVDYTMPANVELMVMSGSGLTGTGSGGSDILASIGGANTLSGLGGDDLYYVYNAGDHVQEAAGGGNDTVVSAVSYTIPGNVETLYVNGSGLTATGSGGTDILWSVGGANTLAGLGGDDSYVVNNTGDQVQEGAGGGTDTVYATVSYTMPANVEALVVIGNGLTGTGSSNADVLASSGGANTLVGLGGDDTYDVGNTGDQVQEAPGGGHDAVVSTVSFTMPANVEALYLNGTGLTGTGSAGDDGMFSLGTGNTLIGNGGNDTFVFQAGATNGDTITDFDGNGAGTGDQLDFVGFGAGATFTQVDATHWQVNYNGGASHETITFANAAAIHASDFAFV